MNGTLQMLAAVLSAFPIAAVALAQGANEYGEEPEQQADVVQTVARISYLDGGASYARGDEPDDWQPADVNVPMTLGDRIYTNDRSRMELRVHGGDTIWAGAHTDLAALNLTEDTKQFALKSGVASFRIREMDANDVWEVDTPNSAVNFEGAGDYRIRVDQDGNTRVAVERGNLTVAAGGGQIGVNAGEEMVIDGIDSPRYDVITRPAADDWDRWVDNRYGRIAHSASYHYVNQDVVGAEDLDQYGSWSNIPNYGMVWAPTQVEAGWVPYRAGHWIWQDPWGWTWVSSEPWGWAPYHSGRWVTYSSRWYWVPVAPAVRVAYAPALVAFVGAGPGFSASVTIGGGGGYVGWFPLAPREPFVPWWAPHPAAVAVNVTNVTYVNKTYVTVVNQNTFVSGGLVARNVVTDTQVVRQVQTTQVVHGAVPVLPTVASTRVAVRPQTSAAAVVRPPAAIVSRAVVARVAPPPAPPRFQQKLAVIQENKRPVDPVAAARLTTQAQARPQAAVAVRPVANAGGNVTLAPRQGATASTAARSRPAPAPVAAAPVRGRAQATAQQPVANEMVSARKIGEKPAPSRPQSATAPAEAGRVAPAPAPKAPVAPAQAEREREIENERDKIQGRPTPRPGIERETAPQREAPPAAPARQSQPEARTRQEAEKPTPNWRGARPTPRESGQPSREVTPQRERAQAPSQSEKAQAEQERERALVQQQQRERAQAQQERERAQAPERERPQTQERAQPQRERPEAQPREQTRPDNERKTSDQPQERKRPTAKPKPTPRPDK
ncbi:MAG TPA: DUF6600 domain-containing protein [Thermoanaerobaculia bacterium]